MKIKKLLFAMASLFVIALMALPAIALAQDDDAKSILKKMSEYVSNQKTIEFTFDSDIEVITPRLEKIQFTNSGGALLSRDRTRFARTVSAAMRMWRSASTERPSAFSASISTATCAVSRFTGTWTI